jgi:hypothetical protein
LLTIQFIEQQLIDHEFLFTTWVMGVAKPLARASIVFMRFAFKPEMEHADGLPAVCRAASRAQRCRPSGGSRLRATPRCSLPPPALRGVCWATPAFAFRLWCGACVRHKGELILNGVRADARSGIIFLFAGVSLGQVLSETGTAKWPTASSHWPGGGFRRGRLPFLTIDHATRATRHDRDCRPDYDRHVRGSTEPIPVYIVAAAGNCGPCSRHRQPPACRWRRRPQMMFGDG